MHASFFVMALSFANDGVVRAKTARAVAYNTRRDHIIDEMARGWAEERKQNDIVIPELEAATYRSRTNAHAEDLVLEDGSSFSSKFGAFPSFAEAADEANY